MLLAPKSCGIITIVRKKSMSTAERRTEGAHRSENKITQTDKKEIHIQRAEPGKVSSGDKRQKGKMSSVEKDRKPSIKIKKSPYSEKKKSK